MQNAPLINIERLEQHYHNTVDLSGIYQKLNRIYLAVKNDTAAEAALAEENHDLRQQLEEILTGETLPPQIQEKVDAIFAKLKENKDKVEKFVTEQSASAQ